ncbi:cytosolic Fe-S cluster assembly factor NUBP1-like protein [Dinothrombium tinctorium]|uniref:Cytosolic Fe-S cluster assembly factor NUBP1 homolog n=1 Tax=Dinothrombium tinctorium TaxID=1965070 RepID=A0A3S3PQD1_9ACAR|nr:cytosolic Fe-S cluster assembly factor NUBP1-like protein [Dinothrombium tinctorium]RWS14344.1 cytosolic Fe-S cluster assembly factor NUBP1-like protein [Dinothrombium tinctorium]RWS14352.1 cytosolic Fe-S cluster assembly factor NUBP1-like protein [Dinothrombium tinctorium]
MNEKPPESCPGIGSQTAGKAAPCQGCPNAAFCASGQTSNALDPAVAEIARRLYSVRNIILVISGKGGVGKSTVATNIARALAEDESVSVGLLDIDVCGPSIPKTMNLEGEEVHQSSSGWSPIFVTDNLCVMSCGFLLPSLDDAVIWRGPKKNGLIKQFLKDVDWGDLHYLVVDTPPGTSDEHMSVVGYLKQCSNLKGAVIVATPQEVALLDVRKQIDFCKRVDLNIIGIVENMSSFVCPKCEKTSIIFKPTSGGVENVCESYNIPLLGKIPIDPLIGKSCDEGTSLYETDASSPTVKCLKEIVTHIVNKCENKL